MRAIRAGEHPPWAIPFSPCRLLSSPLSDSARKADLKGPVSAVLPLVSWGFWLMRSEGRRETHFLLGWRVTPLLMCSLSLSLRLGPQRCRAPWKVCTTSPASCGAPAVSFLPGL